MDFRNKLSIFRFIFNKPLTQKCFIMKKLLIIAFIFCYSLKGFTQDYNDLGNFKFETLESYKTAEPKVLEAANYLFENPSNIAELKRVNAIRYIINWMQGTPDYTFEISSEATDLAKGNSDLLSLYMAAMTKVVLDNPDRVLTNKEIYDHSEELLISYCAKPENSIKPSRKIKKLMKSQ